MHPDTHNPAAESKQSRFGCLQMLVFLLATVITTAVVTVWAVKTYVFPAEFEPVTLNASETKRLQVKLEKISAVTNPSRGAIRGNKPWETSETQPALPLEPEPYTEEQASREISLTETELNALLAKNTDLARKLAIDLSDNLVSAQLLVHLDEDFPILGGRNLKAKAGLELGYAVGNPIVVLRGISIMGIPLPNAWLGELKNIDLVKEFGAQDGFWKSFAAGIEDIQVKEGSLRIRLRE